MRLLKLKQNRPLDRNFWEETLPGFHLNDRQVRMILALRDFWKGPLYAKIPQDEREALGENPFECSSRRGGVIPSIYATIGLWDAVYDHVLEDYLAKVMGTCNSSGLVPWSRFFKRGETRSLFDASEPMDPKYLLLRDLSYCLALSLELDLKKRTKQVSSKIMDAFYKRFER